MTTTQRQYALLAALAVVLAAVLWSGVISGDDPTESAPQPSNPTARGRGAAGRGGPLPVEDVALDRLKADREALQQTQRNPFRFRPAPPPPPPPAGRATQQLAPALSAGPPPPPPIPPIALKYIGFADGAGSRGRIGVFADGRGTVINAYEGDILEGRYRVLRLGTDSADLVYVDGRGRQTIRLSGQ